ncbi:hypothetical protein [Desulfobacula sp.]|uniref:hypothetical protein n=1 Tax=Desulfobacula sp. TaxID=2593537 RepID=UPI001EB51371|nr:hypothetical protein [Desulfobacula sp.]
MTQQTTKIPLSSIILDEAIYPRKGIDHRRVGIFAENIREGFTFDPPYFDKKAADYDKKSISGLSKKGYLDFLEGFFVLLKQNVKKRTRMAFINADWRDFQNKPAIEEKYKGGILIDDYLDILKKTGWYHTHIIQAPMSSQHFNAGVVSAMQKKNILGVISRYVIILGQLGLK